MSREEKRDLSERIRESKKTARTNWERRWKQEHPSVMPRTFNDADTGAVGVNLPGLANPSGDGQGDE
eukprot:8150712-Prorocentrum_lima.AAC.1